jgi:transcriptional regulator with XRE-family HTH domain
MSKRTEQQKITKEAQILKYFREQAGLSMRNAAIKSGLSPTTINHLENGRINIHKHHIMLLLTVYGRTTTEFKNFLNEGISVPDALRNEIIRQIKKLPDKKIIEFQELLKQFTKSI